MQPPPLWYPLRPEAASTLLAGLTVPWWIAGGWALDLFLGRQTREHGDLDILILRRDQLAVQRHLADWDLQACDPPGTLRPWLPDESLRVGIHDIWCRRDAAGPYELQLMLMEHDADRWIFRRDPRVGGALTELGTTSASGLPIWRPEIQLLFKLTSTMRDKDHADVAAVTPHLSPEARAWLRQAQCAVASSSSASSSKP